MNKTKLWGLLAALCLLGFPPLVISEEPLPDEMTLADGGQVKVGNVVNIGLTLTNPTTEIQGLVATFDWNSAGGTGTNLVAAAALAGANTVVTRVEAAYMVLGVVMDNDGVGGEVIPAGGTNTLLATASITAGTTLGVYPVEFKDGLYASVAGGPVLDNVVVVGGLSVGEVEGLVLNDGRFEVVEGFNRFYIKSLEAKKATVLMENLAPVEGYVVALCHDNTKMTLNTIDVGAAATAQAADFAAVEVFPTGGTIGVVIDLEAPYTNNTIPAGDGAEIAVFNYTCLDQGQWDVTFCENELGTPLKENVQVQAGLSISPALQHGKVNCECVPAQEGPPGSASCSDTVDNDCDGLTDSADPGCVSLVENCTNGADDDGDALIDCKDPDCPPCAEICDNGVDDDGDGLVDMEDPSCQRGFMCTSVEASRGGEAVVCFSLMNPEDEVLGAHDMDHIQGFSMAVEYCCDIQATPEFDITGTILEALGAEYVRIDVDNDPLDGDGCQLIIGVLVDALPPFDGRTISSSPDWQKMGCVTFTVKPDAPCGPCCFVNFKDGVNGSGKVPINNLISVENYSYPVAQLQSCEVCIVEQERFFRGDCNFSGDSGGPAEGAVAVDIADAAALVSYLFLTGMYKFEPTCLDACDCNDDGRIDLADVVCVLRYLFQKGKFPPAPGPGWRETGNPNPNNVEATGSGIDPTLDMLDCAAGDQC